MNDRGQVSISVWASDPRLVELTDELTRRLELGEPLDLEAFTAEHSEFADELRKLFPAVRAMVDLGHTASGDQPSPALAVAHVPGTLGDYRLVREIARGGMGVVYEAEQLSLRRRVALKVLPFAAMLTPAHLQRFQNEAQAAAALRHPHIVSVHAVGCERGVHFYAMDLVEGQSLAEVIRELRQPASTKGPNGSEDARKTSSDDTQPIAALSTAHSTNRREFFRRVAQLGIHAARALQFAHERGIVHRDIKPSNLLVDRQGGLWVTDFGLAMTQAGDGLTLTGDLVGTVRYMSPEQASGDRALVDHRTDIYSLGASLYELLTLRPAVDGQDRQALLRMIEEKEPPPPRTLDAAIPRDLETIVLKALARQPQARYASAGELADDLQRFLDLKPIRARRSSRLQKLSHWAHRNPRLATASVLAVLLALVLAIGGPLAALRERQLATDAQALADQLKLQLYDSEMAKAQSAAIHHNFQAAARILAKWIPEPGADDHRSFEWYHLWRRCQPALNLPTLKLEASRLQNHCPVWRAACSPDGRYVAVGDELGDVALHDAESLTLMWDAGHDRPSPNMLRLRQDYERHRDIVSDLVFTSDSKLLISAGRGQTISIWDVPTGAVLHKKSFADAGLEVTSLALAGNTLAAGFGHRDQDSQEPVHVSVWHLDRTGPSPELKESSIGPLRGLRGQVHSLAISGDGRFLAACSRADQIRVFRLEDGRHELSLQSQSGSVRAVAFSPDDNSLLASSSYRETATDQGGGEVKLWDIAEGAAIATLHRNAWHRSLAFSADGGRLAAGDHDGTVRIWDIRSRELRREFVAHHRQVNDLVFTPSGESIFSVSHDRTAKIWTEARKTNEPTCLVGQGAGILRLAVSHDSATLLSAGQNGIAKLWDIRTGKSIGSIEAAKHLDTIYAAEFSPDGEHVAVAGGYFQHFGEPIAVILWDVKTRESKALFSGTSSKQSGAAIYGVAFSPDGDRLAAGIGREIRIWSVPDGQLWKAIPSGFAGLIGDLAWSKQTDRIASLDWSGSCGLKVWESSSGAEVATLPVPNNVSILFRLAFSPDGRQLAVGTLDGEILLYDPVDGRFLERFGDHTDWVWDVDFSPDGKRLASASTDRTVKLWNLETGNDLLTFRDARNAIQSVCFSPDGRALFAPAHHLKDSVIHVWRAARPEDVQMPQYEEDQ